MNLKRIEVTLKFTVKPEQVPGLFYDPQDFGTHGFKAIRDTLVAYKPELVEVTVVAPDGKGN